MIKFYANRFSNKSRCVWITLIEKKLNFELIEIILSDERLNLDLFAINPFHQIPVLVDDNSAILESLAIMDYLEAKYPTPALLPKSPASLAKVKTIELVNNDCLSPQIDALFRQKIFLSLPEKTIKSIAVKSI